MTYGMNLRILSKKFGVVTQDSRYKGYDIGLNGDVTVWSTDVFGNKDEFDHDTELQIEVFKDKFVSLKEVVAVFNSTCKADAVAAEGQVKQDKD
ncbi:hypothetical protein EOM86_12380 [Candidatus Nomurabacteria bacterium]|nr:hypothetical protein [Candidatus Nomurabacteria bacterium]